MRRMWAGAVATGAVLVLAGCTWTAAETTTGADAVAGGGATPTPVATMAFIPDGTAASGEFTSPDGSTSGSFALEVTAGIGEVVLTDLESTHAALEVRLSFDERGDDPCADGNAYAYPSFAPGTDPDPVLLPADYGDWSFLDEIDLIVNSGEGTDDAGCFSRIVAQAPLEWTFAPLRPDLAALEDGGVATGAAGEVQTDGSGRALAYTVAENDTHDAVALRFGITPGDLGYLNPMSVPSVSDEMLYVGQRINLDLEAR